MPTLSLRGVGRVFVGDPPVTALSEVSLDIADGEFVSFVGPSGSGKSTLMNVLSLLDRPDMGSITLGDVDIGSLPERERAALRGSVFGLVFQNFHLIDRLSAAENVQMGLLYRGERPSTRDEAAHAALVRVGLAHRVDQPVNTLSGGEKQRVAIARALVAGAEIVVADEPTGNLDTANSSAIVSLLKDLNRDGVTIVLVTHDVTVAQSAHRMVEMRDGRIVTITENESPSLAENGAPEPGASEQGTESGALAPSTRLRLRDLVGQSVRALTAHRRRSVALLGAVAAAVGLVIATLGLSQTASGQVSDRFDAARNKELTVNVESSGLEVSSTFRSGVPSDTEDRVRSLAGVEEAGLLAETTDNVVSASPGGDGTALSIFGVSDGLFNTADATMEWVPGHDGTLGPREVVVGEVAAAQLNLPILEARPTLKINGTPFAVVGLVEDSSREVRLLTGVVMDIADMRSVAGESGITVLIQTSPGAALGVAEQVGVAIDPYAPDRVTVDVPPDPMTLRGGIEGDVRIALFAVSLVAMIVAVFGIANTASASVAERMSELGLRRALGARRRHLMAQISTESLIAGVVGGFAGLYVGMLAVLVLTIVNEWQPVLDVRLIPLAIAVGITIGTIGGMAATIRAGRIQPVDALRR